jgi:TonB-dependent starch-binding outer membrane protein SusC
MSAQKMFSALFSLVFVLFLQVSFAQDRTVTGKVTDSKDGSPVSGASVTVKGSRTGTSTKNDGTFSLSVSSSATTLVITSIGFEQQEVSIAGQSAVEISFVASSGASLNEVVVTGYGSSKKKDLTGSIGSIKEKDFNKGVFASADQLMQGKISGVQVINNSGQPGGATTVKIRGASAVTGSGQPLYVVDGVPLDGRSVRPGIGDIGLGGSNPGNNPLNFINPSDIASIDVLKDASATAIYGSRAAYGVVLITTKRGKSGEPKIEFNTSIGTSKIAKRIEVLDASQFRQALTYYGLSAANDKGANVNALDEILQTGMIQNYNVSVSGGNENARYRLSLGVMDQEGIVKKSGIKKYTANVNLNFKFLESKKLGLDVNIIPSQYKEEIAPISNDAGSRGSLIGNALQWNPTEAFRKPDGTLNILVGGDLLNPVAVQEAINDHTRITTVLASISPYYKFTKELEYRFLYSINYGTGMRGTTVAPYINFNDTYGKGRVRLANSELITQSITHTLSYNKQITSDLSLNAVAGYEYLKYISKGYELGGFGNANGGFGDFGLNYEDYIQFSNPTNRSISSYNDPTNELQSYFVRTGFNYRDKYLLTATFRADGSTKFGKNNRYGYFPSFGAAWNISKEKFFNVSFINSLKLRAGWGKTGNSEFPSGSAQFRYGFSGNGSGAFSAINNANDDLKWQADRQFNVGFDLAVLKSRINITFDYFNKRTTDLLFPTEAAVPGVAGVPRWFNLAGNIDNKGIEAAVNASIIAKKDISWDFGVNATFITNEVSGLSSQINTGGLHGQGITGTTVEVIKNGLPINAFYTKRFLSWDKSGAGGTAFAVYEDDGYTLFYVGNPNPKMVLGLSTTLRYKKLSLVANMNGAFGHDIYNNTLNSVINVGSINNGKNIATSVFKDPVKESFANPLSASSRFLEKGNYLKMANMTLSYAFGDLGKHVKGLSVYITGQNLFVLTDFSGFDPEVNVDKNQNGVPSQSIEYIPYPSARIFSFGINVGF